MPPACLAEDGIPPDDKTLAAFRKVTGVWGWLGNFPATREADAVGVEHPAKPAAIWPPTEIGMRVHSSRDRLAEQVVLAERQKSAQQAGQGDLVGRHSTISIPDARIGIAENSIADFAITRARVRPIGVDNRFNSILS